MEIALREFPDLTSPQIAEMCGVCNHMVDDMRPKEQVGENPTSTRTGADGKQYPAKRTKTQRHTETDKRRCVEIALREFPDLSSRQIAEMCGVSHHTVEDLRPNEQLGKLPTSTRTGSDGKKYPAKRKKTQRHTETDKRRCVEIALREFPKESSRQISEMCGVGYDLVQRMKPELTDSVNATVTTKDGRQYPAKRTKSQRRKFKPVDRFIFQLFLRNRKKQAILDLRITKVMEQITWARSY